MRFRGRITELNCVRQFAQLLHTLSKCSSQFVLRINPDKLIFVLSEKDVRSNGATAWCVVPKNAYFNDFKMEGVTPAANEIYLEISSEMLATRLNTLKSSNSVLSIKIKLTNKVVPCLSFEIESESVKSHTVCTHDIPVTILNRSHWKDYQEPDFPQFDISLDMPELKIVRGALDRIRSCGTRVLVTAESGNNGNGTLIFSIQSYSVTSTVRFPDLRIYDIDKDDTQSTQNRNRTPSIGGRTKKSLPNENGSVDEAKYRVEVDVKHLMNLIPTDDLKPDNFVCSVVDNHMLHLFYIYGEITLQYSVPGIL